MSRIKISTLIVLICSILLFVISGKLSVITEESTNERFYRQGLEFVENNDYQNAYYNFKKISLHSTLAPAGLYRQARCAENLEDWDSAIEKYGKLIKRFPHSIFTPKSRYNLAQVYYKQAKTTEAEQVFLMLKEKHTDTEFAIAADYYLGLIYKSNYPQKAKTHWLSYIILSPKGKYAVSCADELIRIQLITTPGDRLSVAKVYFNNNNYPNTLRFLNGVPTEQSWYYKGISQHKVGANAQAISTLENGIVHNWKHTPPELTREAVDCYVNIKSYDKRFNIKRLADLSSKKSNIYDYLLYRLSKYGNNTEKYKIYEQIAHNYPEGNYASDAIWNLFWKEFKAKNYGKAQKIGKHHISQYENTQASAKVLFWMAKASELVKKPNEAKMYYAQILRKYPDDYYAFRAHSILHKAESVNQGWKSNPKNILPDNEVKISPSQSYSKIHRSNIKMLHYLAKIGDFAILDGLDLNNKMFQSWIDYNQGRYTRAALVARDSLNETKQKPDFSDDIYKIAYPLHFTSKVNAYSKALNLDPYLIISIIREESYFDTKAQSGVGAMGLMQLMPVTAKYISSKYNIPLVSVRYLFDPKTNIKFGCAYFNYTKSKLNNNNMLSIAAYNGGPTAVSSWKQNLEYKDYDEFIENIPYEETQKYVKKVFKSYWNYMNIYDTKQIND